MLSEALTGGIIKLTFPESRVLVLVNILLVLFCFVFLFFVFCKQSTLVKCFRFMCQRHFGPWNSNSTQAPTEPPATHPPWHFLIILKVEMLFS